MSDGEEVSVVVRLPLKDVFKVFDERIWDEVSDLAGGVVSEPVPVVGSARVVDGDLAFTVEGYLEARDRFASGDDSEDVEQNNNNEE